MQALNNKETAKKLGVSTARVTQLVKEGKLTPINKRKRGKRFFAQFDAVEVELFMAKRNGEHKPRVTKTEKTEQPKGIHAELKEVKTLLLKILAKL